MSKELNSYDLSRIWFNFCFSNPDKIVPNHSALYFFCIEHCNRLGWKEKFGLPTEMAKEAIGIRSYNTYIKTLTDLVAWGFIILLEKSKNQYSANIIALSNNNKALDKALDKAFIKHALKQGESTQQSIYSIDKPLTINHKPLNKEQLEKELLNSFTLIEEATKHTGNKLTSENKLKQFISEQNAIEDFEGRTLKELRKHYLSWVKLQPKEVIKPSGINKDGSTILTKW